MRIDNETGEYIYTSQEELILKLDDQVDNLKKCIENIKETLRGEFTDEEKIEDIKKIIEEYEHD